MIMREDGEGDDGRVDGDESAVDLVASLLVKVPFPAVSELRGGAILNS